MIEEISYPRRKPGKASKRPVVKSLGRYKTTKRGRRARGEKSLSKLKKELDSIFSKFIRSKYGPNCYTCKGEKGNQNGHFVSRTYLSVRWDEDNCRPQGMRCNIFNHGMTVDFEENLVNEIGKDRVEAVKAKRKELFKPTREFYEESIQKYTALISTLEEKAVG